MSDAAARTLSLGFSPCPNDTFIFYALVHGALAQRQISFSERLLDVEALNALVLAGELDISKVSYHLLGHVLDRYCLLRSGGALGRGCGPLLVSRSHLPLEGLAGKSVAIPGIYTTAALLLRLFEPRITRLVVLPFHEIMAAVAAGTVDAGVIIHESRFTFQQFGLTKLVDLGSWWEEETGKPIPLGGIVARRDLGRETIGEVERLVRESLVYSRRHPAEAHAYIRSHAQEMSDEVCASHIDLYVNRFSEDVGAEGEEAIEVLFERAEREGLIPPRRSSLFVA
ncbi:MAG TPA: 1,4-dihydroxy-6-naphthoate synthase [Geobacterales bacterium]|nr:1,4-dihydroxy-6-naphthoate synthase [Geobacterales bacterium]